MERRSTSCFTSRMSGFTRLSAPDAIARLRLLQLGDQPIDSPRERGDLALRKIVAQLLAPFQIGGAELVDQRASAAGELHARRAEVLRIIVTLGQAELLEAR